MRGRLLLRCKTRRRSTRREVRRRGLHKRGLTRSTELLLTRGLTGLLARMLVGVRPGVLRGLLARELTWLRCPSLAWELAWDLAWDLARRPELAGGRHTARHRELSGSRRLCLRWTRGLVWLLELIWGRVLARWLARRLARALCGLPRLTGARALLIPPSLPTTRVLSTVLTWWWHEGRLRHACERTAKAKGLPQR